MNQPLSAHLKAFTLPALSRSHPGQVARCDSVLWGYQEWAFLPILKIVIPPSPCPDLD